MPRLTDQQRTFAREYVRSGFDREQAIKAANYSERNWASIACKLLKKSQVKAEIDRLLGQVEEKCTVETGEIIQELRKVAFAPVSERVSNSDRIRALELLGKFKSMFSDRLILGEDEQQRELTESMKVEAEILCELSNRYSLWINREVSHRLLGGESHRLPSFDEHVVCDAVEKKREI